MRRIKFVDHDTNKLFNFLTNQFMLPAIIITELYKNRWKIEGAKADDEAIKFESKCSSNDSGEIQVTAWIK